MYGKLATNLMINTICVTFENEEFNMYHTLCKQNLNQNSREEMTEVSH